MEFNPQNAFTNAGAVLRQLSALLVSYSLSFIGAVLLLIIGYFIAGLVERWLNAALSHIHGFDLTLRNFFSKIARYAILILVFIMVLGQFGVQTASIIAAIGAVGLAIGLALQGTLQNIAAGVMLLVLRPFRIGEEVQVGTIRGTVNEIGLFATSLHTGDGLYILAPNSTLWSQPVTNFTRNQTRSNGITVRIKPDADIDRAQRSLLELARNDGRVLKEKAPSVSVTEVADDVVTLTLTYWTNVGDFGGTKNDLTKQAKLMLDRDGLSKA
ncbi:MAG: mechanosensitive ion channel [Methylobacterium mesophilicum]|nr:mechanosensitive ion channel [Methylobacterium mesophilicum]